MIITEAGRAPHIADKLRRLSQAANELREHASGYIHSLLQLLSRYQEPEAKEYGEELRARDQNDRGRDRDRELGRVGRSSSPRPSDGTKVAEGKEKEKDSKDKEELARKSKLLAAMKVARTADLNALQQWKAEAARLDDNCKRLQRAVEAKDSLLKDLRTKLSLDEQKSKEKEVIGTDVASLSAAELRNRYALHLSCVVGFRFSFGLSVLVVCGRQSWSGHADELDCKFSKKKSSNWFPHYI